jgi:hypothetical protein
VFRCQDNGEGSGFVSFNLFSDTRLRERSRFSAAKARNLTPDILVKSETDKYRCPGSILNDKKGP